MVLMASLSSFYSVTTLKPQSSSSSSSSSSYSNNKSIHALCSFPSISQTHLIKFDSTRRLSIRFRRPVAPSAVIAAAMKSEPLKVVISGAPASGKGTQCELITKKEVVADAGTHEGCDIALMLCMEDFIKENKSIGGRRSARDVRKYIADHPSKYGLVHISAGDLLRAEVASGTENGKRAKEYMEKGMLVPDEIVVMMVKERLLQPDAQENGWLLDGYPRSLSQAKALEDLGIRPDLFILLDVSEDILVERVVGRRLDPVTGKIYHLEYSPPENEEISARLVQRFDDTEEKVKLRLQTHHHNVDAVLSLYKDVIYKVNGNAPKEDVFAEIDNALSSVVEKKSKMDSASMMAGMSS